MSQRANLPPLGGRWLPLSPGAEQADGCFCPTVPHSCCVCSPQTPPRCLHIPIPVCHDECPTFQLWLGALLVLASPAHPTVLWAFTCFI